ncbi:hypothetical protein GCK32_010005, partial [Trichostrongylus colubriformis]
MLFLLQTIAECLLAVFYIFVIIFIVSSKAKVFRNSFFLMFVATGKTSACIAIALCLETVPNIRQIFCSEGGLIKELPLSYEETTKTTIAAPALSSCERRVRLGTQADLPNRPPRNETIRELLWTSYLSMISKLFYAGIADVISILSLCFLRLNRELDLGEEYKQMVLVALIGNGTGYIAHMIGNMVIAANRYSAICFIHLYDKVTQASYVIFHFFHPPRSDLVYIRKPDGTSTYKGLQKQTDMIARCTYVAFAMVYAFVSVCINLRIFFEWRKISRSNNGSERKLREK